MQDVESQCDLLTKAKEAAKLKGSDKYSQHKEFIDGLYNKGCLTEEEYNDISGVGWWDNEKNMDYVTKLLLDKYSAQQFGIEHMDKTNS